MKPSVTTSLIALSLVSACAGSPAVALDVSKHSIIQEVIEDLTTRHSYPRAELERLFARVQLRPQVVEAMQRPYEALPWHQYRKLFVTDAHVTAGIRFWQQHEEALARAESRYGIPKQVIVAIIGVETRYGRRMGHHSVLDSLTTLVIQYPRRREFFKTELQQFLLLAREEGLDPLSIKGSYAGAMGVPQFIASSYRRYAVDFNGDNRRDLLEQPVDAIGSVANYLHLHRWQIGAPIVGDAEIGPSAAVDRHVTNKLKPNSTLTRLRQAGIKTAVEADGDVRAALVRLDNGETGEYRIAFENFYVITKYNRSIHYAMAVFELSEAIRKRQMAG